MTHTQSQAVSATDQIVRRTVAAPASYSGITLFTGVQSSVTVRPAAAGEGIVFRRVDLAGGLDRPIPVRVEHVVSENRRTVLVADPAAEVGKAGGAAKDDCRVQTVEHLLAALAGLAITDAIVDVNGPEVPVADGSALPFVEMMREVGTLTLSANSSWLGEMARPIVIHEPIVLSAGSGPMAGEIAAYPSEKGDYRVEYHLDYGVASPIAAQSAMATMVLGSPCRVFAEEIAPARTFCLLAEAQAMRQLGFFHHLTPAEMLVIGDEGPIDNQYRFSDEPARHKLLDVVGDLMLAGRPIIGRIVAKRSGHALNHALARAILAAR